MNKIKKDKEIKIENRTQTMNIPKNIINQIQNIEEK